MDESQSDQAHHHAPNTVTEALLEQGFVERMYRFEGPSDPGDEMIVFALLDPATGVRGTLATAFGLAADPDLAGHLADLSRRFR